MFTFCLDDFLTVNNVWDYVSLFSSFRKLLNQSVSINVIFSIQSLELLPNLFDVAFYFNSNIYIKIIDKSIKIHIQKEDA